MLAVIDHQALVEKYAELVEIACVCCDAPELATRIRIEWNDRFTSRMGDACWSPNAYHGRVRLSLPLWSKASAAQQDEVVIHEACHVIADFKAGRRQGHSYQWQEMMQRCGYSAPQRCHAVAFDEIKARRMSRRIQVHCACPTPLSVSRVMAAKLLQGATAVCKRCWQPVRL